MSELATLNPAARAAVRDCPICESPELSYEFPIDNRQAFNCERCTLLFLNPRESASVGAGVTSHASPTDAAMEDIHALNVASALDRLVRYTGVSRGRLLLVNATDAMKAEAQNRGFQVSSLTLEQLDDNGGPIPIADGTIDACLLYRSLETANHPGRVLESVHRLMTPGGSLMVISPTIDSRAARLFRAYWWEFRKQNQFYFSVDTLQNLLLKTGFGEPIVLHDDSVVSLRYMRAKLSGMPAAWRYRLLRLVLSLSPGFISNRAFPFLNSRTAMLVRAKVRDARHKLSVIVPVYNERATIAPLLDRLLAKTLDDTDIEIIIVESNSTDGSRQEVLAYEHHPRVAVILEERPRGKGYAVRTGLKAASGDVVLIQDADLEYDIDDYDSLVRPIVRYERNFVIGSRHLLKGRVWKVRQFNDAAGLAAFFNFGHVVFLTLFNLIYQQRLNDPFSMFKVFRRECLYGLVFECDRFDFDFELAIKLLRKGYQPIELPVNYTARSFTEGKKVTVFRDPVTWLRALAKFRTSRLYPEFERE